MRGLKVEPELGSGPEGLGKKPRGLRRNSALAANEFIDALDGHADVLGKSDLGLPERDEELLAQDFPRVRRDSIGGLHGLTPVVVDDLDVVGLRLGPAKDHAPLLVDANTVETRKVAFERFEPVPWR